MDATTTRDKRECHHCGADIEAGFVDDWACYELADRKMWVRMGADWATLADLAESVA